jgi:hypothetical protein
MPDRYLDLTDAFKEPRMPEPILTDELLKHHYIELVCLHTKLQYDTVPTTYSELIESALDRDFINLERELLNHPLTNIHMEFAIFMRVAWAEAVLYGLTDPETKRKMLLRLRDSYRAGQRLPEQWRDAFAPVWAHWTEVLNEWEECDA